MAHAQVYLHRGVDKIEKSIRAKTFEFMTKVQEDDSLPGLDIKLPKGAYDRNVRTGRVDDFWRAVMFKLKSSSNGTNHYVLVGVYPHDGAYTKAGTLSLSVNAVNGVTELLELQEPAESIEDTSSVAHDAGSPAPSTSAAEPAAEPADARATTPESAEAPATQQPMPTAPGVGEKHVGQTLAKVGAEVMTNRLGLNALLVDAALQRGTVDDLLDLLERTRVPEWQSDVLLDLASGSSADETALKMSFRQETADEQSEAGMDADTGTDTDAQATASCKDESVQLSEATATDEDRIIAGLHTDAAKLSFAVVEGEDELRAAIEDGDFAAWRVFLHPEQRRWAQRNYNGSFRLSGGAGTGKTVVLVHRAVRLQREGIAAGEASPRILLTTFTKNLAGELASQVTMLEPKAGLADRLGAAGIHVSGVDKLASVILRGAGEDELRAATAAVLGTPRVSVFGKTRPDAWREAIRVSGVELPDRGDGHAFIESEYDLVALAGGIIDRAEYLKVRRPNRGVRLSRGQRGDVWTVIQAYREQSLIDQSVSFEETLHIAARVLTDRAAQDDRPGNAEQVRNGAYSLDHVLVDEGQDLTVGHLRLLRSLVRKKPNDIFLAEDSHQRIYGQKIVLSHFGINIQGRSRKLTLNYRTTEKNLQFGMNILEGAEAAEGGYDDLEGTGEARTGYRSLRKGVPPRLLCFAKSQEEFDAIAGVMRSWLAECADDPALKPEQLAILTRSKKVRDDVVRGLADRGVDVKAVEAGSVGRGTPVALTMHRAKGTEFRNVVLAGVSDKGIPAALKAQRYSEEADADIDQRERSLLYVAATRARDQLVVTWTGERSRFIGRVGSSL